MKSGKKGEGANVLPIWRGGGGGGGRGVAVRKAKYGDGTTCVTYLYMSFLSTRLAQKEVCYLTFRGLYDCLKSTKGNKGCSSYLLITCICASSCFPAD